MRKGITGHGLASTTVAVLGLFLARADAQHGWPIRPTDSTHPIGNSFGEFQRFGDDGSYQHKGIDILSVPMIDAVGSVDPSAPWVTVTVEGVVLELYDELETYNNYTTVLGVDGILYKYGHLAPGSYDGDYKWCSDHWATVYPGYKIAKVVRWNQWDSDCDFHHLHYELYSEVGESQEWLNPFSEVPPPSPPDPRISPHVDDDPPEIRAILFGENHATPWDSSTPWVQIDPVAPGACRKLSGQVDIVVQARDRDDAGTTAAQTGIDTQWIYNMFWRACPESTPDCPWQGTRALDRLPWECGQPGNALTKALFSYSPPWQSSSNYCHATWLYAIATNFVGEELDARAAWDTTAVPDGHYTVGVQLVDFAGNKSSAYASVCVANGAGSFPELAIRDALGDDGAIPYAGRVISESPDIKCNPGTPNENRYILIGGANSIEVTVWNLGCSAMSAGSTYEVGIEWVSSGPAAPAPVPIASKTVTVPTGGMPPGTSRMESFTWTPAAPGLSPGSGSLRAWVRSAQDAKQATASVEWDDNQAQRNLTVK